MSLAGSRSRPTRSATLLLAPLIAAVLATACDGRTYEPGAGNGPERVPTRTPGTPDTHDEPDGCTGTPTDCWPDSCDTDVGTSAVCVDGGWACPEGYSTQGWSGGINGCGDPEPDCGPTPPPSAPCVRACDSLESFGLECRGGSWQCPADTFEMASCSPDRCEGNCQKDVCPDTAAPPAQESRQRVTFRFGAATGHLVTLGNSCGSFQIEQLEGGSASTLTLGLAPQVICEGPAPQGPSPAFAQDLAAGNVTMEWDARQLAVYSACVDCATRGWPGAGWVTYSEAAPQTVAAGRYRATFAVIDDLEAFGCSAGSEGSASCYPQQVEPRYGVYEPHCGGSRTVSVEFDLPTDGDLEVLIP